MVDEEGHLKIVVAGAGGAGCNTINRLAGMGNCGAKLLAFNTDKLHLRHISDRAERILLGASVTRGLGAGGDPKVAAKAALASRKLIEQEVHDADMVFVTAGMGGGTGTGVAPIIARMARENGALVVGIVSFPFAMERARLKKARQGTAKLADECDSLVVIQNDRLYQWVPNMQIEKAFALADEVTAKAVAGISRTILEPSLVNLDFSDLKHVMADGGLAMISVGEGSGYDRIPQISEHILKHPLLDVDYTEASGALMQFAGGADLTLGEATDLGEKLMDNLGEQVHVAWGARIDERVERSLEAFVIFTGIPSPLLLDPDAAEGRKKEED